VDGRRLSAGPHSQSELSTWRYICMNVLSDTKLIINTIFEIPQTMPLNLSMMYEAALY